MLIAGDYLIIPFSFFRCRIHSINAPVYESTTTRTAGGLDFATKGGKRQGHAVPRSLRVKLGAKLPVWKTQSQQRALLNRLIEWRQHFYGAVNGRNT